MTIINPSFSSTDDLYVTPCTGGPVLWNWEQDSWIRILAGDSVIRVGAYTLYRYYLADSPE
jgi:hypothetical protein